MTSSAVPGRVVKGRVEAGKVSISAGTGYEIILQIGGDSSLSGILTEGIFSLTSERPFKQGTYTAPKRSWKGGLSTPFEVRMGFPGYFPAFDVDSGTVTVQQSTDSISGTFSLLCSVCADSGKPEVWFRGTFAYR